MKAVYGAFSKSLNIEPLIRNALLVDKTLSTKLSHWVKTNNSVTVYLFRNKYEFKINYYEKDGISIGIIGRIFHKKLKNHDIPRIVYQKYELNNLDLIKGMYGDFGIVITDKKKDSVTLISDYLAIKPLFYANTTNFFMFGTDVWSMMNSDCLPNDINLDALSSWLCFDHVLGDDTLFKCINKVPAGTILTYRNGKITKKRYDTFYVPTRKITKEEALPEVHKIVSTTLNKLIEGEDQIGCFLSGGFDSRYILALLHNFGAEFDVYTVYGDSTEEEAAKNVLTCLNLKAHEIASDKSLFDLYGIPYYFSKWGFPMGKFYPIVPVEQYGIRHLMIDGLLGDDLIRGYDYESKILEIANKNKSLEKGIYLAHLSRNPSTVFNDSLSTRIILRSLSQIKNFCEEINGSTIMKAYLWLLLERKGNYHANNHLQYSDYTETIHPFYSTDLIKFRLAHDSSIFTMEFYKALLNKNFPILSKIQHSSELNIKYNLRKKLSKYIWKHNMESISYMLKYLKKDIYNNRYLFARMPLFNFGKVGYQDLCFYVFKFTMLLKRLEKENIEIQWSEI